ncbi:MAG: GNAT family N-acetyltransferase [Candidatus Heimdallarchaeota archaeon]|nr:GNAT family N-acetyltransferase [Candidatus Heimdallarchaeota archaeon]MBY8995402.1 GNAT family N-acetyltransferase [Candidatus Heimdallarchaeota archaeon]
MIVEYPKNDQHKLIPLLSNHKYLSILIKTVLKESEGDILVDNIEEPNIALMSYKVFEVIGGDSSNEKATELLKFIPENRMILFPDDDWYEFTKTKLVLSPYPRTKFSSEKLSIERANEILEKKLPDEYKLQKVDSEIVRKINPKLAPAFLPFYKTSEDFVERGLAYCITESDFIISIAGSSMPIYDNEFDLQAITDPNPKYRRKGLASAACAALIKESLEKGITPYWDADNEISVRFALKLGFTKPEAYTAYLCSKNPLR